MTSVYHSIALNFLTEPHRDTEVQKFFKNLPKFVLTTNWNASIIDKKWSAGYHCWNLLYRNKIQL